MKVTHEFEPVFNENSQILILGTFPSVKSRINQFYYGHPQNRFWKVLAQVTDDEMPITIEEKKKFLLKHNIALWDVIASCEIHGSSDSSIRNVKPVDIDRVLKGSSIMKIFTNGKKADALYKKYLCKTAGIESVCLPSTSPANATFSLEKLVEVWKENIKKTIFIQ